MLDPSRTPTEVQRDAAHILRDIWQQFPKRLPHLIEPDEEENPDDD